VLPAVPGQVSKASQSDEAKLQPADTISGPNFLLIAHAAATENRTTASQLAWDALLAHVCG